MCWQLVFLYSTLICCYILPMKIKRLELVILFCPILFQLMYEHYYVETKINSHRNKHWQVSIIANIEYTLFFVTLRVRSMSCKFALKL